MSLRGRRRLTRPLKPSINRGRDRQTEGLVTLRWSLTAAASRRLRKLQTRKWICILSRICERALDCLTGDKPCLDGGIPNTLRSSFYCFDHNILIETWTCFCFRRFLGLWCVIKTKKKYVCMLRGRGGGAINQPFKYQKRCVCVYLFGKVGISNTGNLGVFGLCLQASCVLTRILNANWFDIRRCGLYGPMIRLFMKPYVPVVFYSYAKRAIEPAAEEDLLWCDS